MIIIPWPFTYNNFTFEKRMQVWNVPLAILSEVCLQFTPVRHLLLLASFPGSQQPSF